MSDWKDPPNPPGKKPESGGRSGLPKSLRGLKRPAGYALAAALALLAAQAAYYARVFNRLPPAAPPAELVLVYGGGLGPSKVARRWPVPGETPLYLFSGWSRSDLALEKTLAMDPGRTLVEDRARTTDQNARYSAPILLKTGARWVVLALPWYHLPRALFLTRLYLWGKGVTVTPFAATPLPEHWWLHRDFYVELLKFWGSLARIGLSWAGVVNWPAPLAGP